MSRFGRRPSLSDSDKAIWALYARDVSPLPGVALPEPPATLPVAPRAPADPVPIHVSPRSTGQRVAALVVGSAPGGVDGGTWTRFRTGKLQAVRTLDLHGRTAQRAHAALDHFLLSAAAEGVRCVEVITGRGKGETGGVIRREFPMWLNQPHLRALILAAAHPHALNPGSVRLLLRRRRAEAR